MALHEAGVVVIWASQEEIEVLRREETLGRKPADPGDVRFEHGTLDDGSGWLHMIDDRGEIVETHFFDRAQDMWPMVEAHREAQARHEEADRLGVHPLELAFAPFGPEWQREQEERRGY